MNKIQYLIIILFCTVSQVLFSQNDFVSGYIITNENDTIQGELSNQSNIQNSRVCRFREEGNDVVEYHPFDIVGFRFADGQFYISKEVDQKGVKQKVFLEYLVDGTVDLYYLKKEYGKQSYFIEKEGELVELTNEIKEFKDEYGQRYRRNSGLYKGALNYAFSDSPSNIKRKINGVRYNPKSLIRFTEDYHNLVCDEYECINYTKSSRGEWFFEINCGVGFGTMAMRDYTNNLKDVHPIIGSNFRYNPKGSDPAWNFLVGLELALPKFDGDYNLGIGDAYLFSMYIKYTAIKLPLTIEYTLPTGRLRPFLFLRFSPSLYVVNEAETYYYRIVKTYSGAWDEELLDYVVSEKEHIEYLEAAEPTSSSLQYNFSIGAGLKYLPEANYYLYIKAEGEKTDKFIMNYADYRSFGITLGMGFSLTK